MEPTVSDCPEQPYRYFWFEGLQSKYPKQGEKLYVPHEKDHAIVITPSVAEGKFKGRTQVQYVSDQTRYHVHPEKVVRSGPAHVPRIVVCERTQSFRRLAAAVPDKDQVVIEIGSSYGVCTDILSRSSKRVLGFEISREAVTSARKKYPHCEFHCVDCLSDKKTFLSLIAEERPYAVFIDIGGNRALEAVSLMLPFLETHVQPEVIVVKSEELVNLVEFHADDDGEVPDPVSFQRNLVDNANASLQHQGASARTSQIGTTVLDAGHVKLLHPLQYPKAQTASGEYICRYFNYKECKKGDCCEFVHGTCHVCLKEGHRGKECVTFAS